MSKNKPSLGADCAIDVDKLVESRLLVQANSGAGKSWALRRLLEQTYGRVQQILIDVDGEFHTLREQFDYVLAGQKGDCPADIKSAALLARRLLELNVSAIVDIYELGAQKKLFVKRFLDSLVSAPRELWHPVLVVLDEAHMFAPESGQSESAAAVIDLMTLGRKRGFCGVLATQRISKLHKDACAECNNKLIGRAALDIDMKRAAGELGFTSREDTQSLRVLQPGEFYAFGPALSNTVEKIKVGPVKTTHLRAGQRAAPPTPPREKVKKILAQLADLPHEAEQEAKTAADLRVQVRQLTAELRTAKKVQLPAPKAETKIIEKPMIKPADLVRLEKVADNVEARAAILGVQVTTLKEIVNRITNFHKPIVLPIKQPMQAPPGFALQPERPANGVRPIDPVLKGTAQALRNREPNGKLPPGEVAVLRALIQYPDGLHKRQLTVLTGYKRSTRDAYISRLREKGYVTERGDKVYATQAGVDEIPDAEPLPTGEALREFWYGKLPPGEKQVLQQLVEAYPSEVDKPSIDEVTGFKRSTRDAYLSRLTAKELVVEVNRGMVKASATLFEVA